MYSFKIMLAGKVVAVNAIYESTVKYCKDYLTDSSDADIEVSVAPDDLEYEREKSRAELTQKELSHLTDRYYELTAVYRKIAESLVDYNIILFHGSCLAVDGEAFIFTAKSGTGKSTHARLWREKFGDRCVMINDDKPLLEITDTGVVVWGTPWNGKHRLGTNTSAPLSAICILERAAENNIRRQSLLAVFPEIFSQTYRFSDPEKMRKTLVLLETAMNRVGLFRLGCNMDPSAADVSYNGMKGNNNNET